MNELINLDQGVDLDNDENDGEEEKEVKKMEAEDKAKEHDWDKVDERIQAKYEMVQKMGKGNYGTVWKAINKTNRDRIAIKKINNAFINKIDAIRTLREISIMNELGKHPNLIQLYTVHVGKNNRDVYLVFELCEADLHTVIRSGVTTEL
jgi:mitogen-activated protein kinase 15